MQELESCHVDVHVVKTLHSHLHTQQSQHCSCFVPDLCSCSVKSQQQVWQCALCSSIHDACESNRNHCRQAGLISCSLTKQTLVRELAWLDTGTLLAPHGRPPMHKLVGCWCELWETLCSGNTYPACYIVLQCICNHAAAASRHYQGHSKGNRQA